MNAQDRQRLAAMEKMLAAQPFTSENMGHQQHQDRLFLIRLIKTLDISPKV